MGASHARGFVAEGANVVIADVLEQERRARFNSIHPGPVRTPMIAGLDAAAAPGLSRGGRVFLQVRRSMKSRGEATAREGGH